MKMENSGITCTALITNYEAGQPATYRRVHGHEVYGIYSITSPVGSDVTTVINRNTGEQFPLHNGQSMPIGKNAEIQHCASPIRRNH